MSMEISNCRVGYEERMKTEQTPERLEKTKEAQKTQDETNESGKSAVFEDEYVSSEESGAKPNGLYRLGQDEHGRRKIFFDAPDKSQDAKKCTTNTDKVEQEIRNLKEKRQLLEQQIKAASGDEKKVRELEQKLAQVVSELSRKDNDTYRRQNASVSEEK